MLSSEEILTFFGIDCINLDPIKQSELLNIIKSTALTLRATYLDLLPKEDIKTFSEMYSVSNVDECIIDIKHSLCLH